MEWLRSLGVPEEVLGAILTLYEICSGWLYTLDELFDNVLSNIGMKQGYPLSLTLFGLYIDDLKSFILETIGSKCGCLLHGSKLSYFFFLMILYYYLTWLRVCTLYSMLSIGSVLGRSWHWTLARLRLWNLIFWRPCWSEHISSFMIVVSRLPPRVLTWECSS